MNDPCTDTSSLFKHFSVAVFGSGCVGKATAENLIRNHIGSVCFAILSVALAVPRPAFECCLSWAANG